MEYKSSIIWYPQQQLGLIKKKKIPIYFHKLKSKKESAPDIFVCNYCSIIERQPRIGFAWLMLR